MKFRTILVIALLLVAPYLGAVVSYSQACGDIAYWNKRFATVADSIHKSADKHYSRSGIFGPQTEFESTPRYIQRLMSGYHEVKKREFDTFLPWLDRMFAVYAQEVSMGSASFTLGIYDADRELMPLEITVLDTVKLQLKTKIAPSNAKTLKEKQKQCRLRVFGAYGILDHPSPYRYTITGPDGRDIINERLPVFQHVPVFDASSNIIPRKNRQEFWLESYGKQEAVFSAAKAKATLSKDHLFVRGCSSGQMSNRTVGRSGYKRDTREYALLKYDFTASDTLQTYLRCKDVDYKGDLPKHSGLSPEGRIIVQEHADSTNLYDFASGRNLGRVLKYKNKNIGGKSYVFDPFEYRIYIIGYEDQYYYDVLKKEAVPFSLPATESRANNSNTHAALWYHDSNTLLLLNLKTKDIVPVKLKDSGNPEQSLQIRAVDFSPDDRLLAVLAGTGNYYQSYLLVYDMRNRNLLRMISITSGWRIAFSKDGQNILCTDDRSRNVNVIHLGIQPGELSR
jgi:hypothetical protein